MNSTIAILLLAAIAFLIYRLAKNQSSSRTPLVEAVEFVVEHESDSKYPQHTEIKTN